MTVIDFSRWRDILSLWIGRLIVYILILPKSIYEFKGISIKIPDNIHYFCSNQQGDIKIHLEKQKDLQICKIILKENRVCGHTS